MKKILLNIAIICLMAFGAMYAKAQTTIIPSLETFPIKTAGYESTNDLIKAVKNKKYEIVDEAMAMIKSPGFKMEALPPVIKIAVVTLGHLHLANGATFKQICEKATEMGYRLCPPEIALLLCLHHAPGNGDGIYIGMQPMTSPKSQNIFMIERSDGGGGLKLYASLADSKVSPWQENDRFAFCAQ